MKNELMASWWRGDADHYASISIHLCDHTLIVPHVIYSSITYMVSDTYFKQPVHEIVMGSPCIYTETLHLSFRMDVLSDVLVYLHYKS